MQTQVLEVIGLGWFLESPMVILSNSSNKTVHLLEFPNYIEVTLKGHSVYNNTVKWKANKVALVT